VWTHFLLFICSSRILQFLSGFVIKLFQKTTESYTNLSSFKMYLFIPLKRNKIFSNNLQCTMSEASTENGNFETSPSFSSQYFLKFKSLHLELKKSFALRTLLKLQYFSGMTLLRRSKHVFMKKYLINSVPPYLIVIVCNKIYSPLVYLALLTCHTWQHNGITYFYLLL